MARRPLAIAILAALAAGQCAVAQTFGGAIDDGRTIALPGNTRPEATSANDRGALPDDFPLDHMQLLLKPAAEIQAAQDRLVERLTHPGSSDFHRWLTATDYGARFGPTPAAVAATTGWLAAHGFTVNGISEGRTIVDFSGTAGAVRAAFHTEIHRLDVNGIAHIANMSDPAIPVTLSGVVAGVISLHDFRPHTNVVPAPDYTTTLNNKTVELVAPADLAKIYNLSPLFTTGTTGTGETIDVIENSDVHALADWTTFRSVLGLARFHSGSIAQIHPTGSATCTDPGETAAEGEATLDAQWAGAAAPGAAIVLASCAHAGPTNGVLIALENVINGSTPPPVISLSYGDCEADNGATANAAFSAIYKQAAMEGISVYVSAGDEGGDRCDGKAGAATHGISINAYAATAYNMAVGGTDFVDTYAGTTDTYWNKTNTGTYESALSYVPEIPWNDSCASVLISTTRGFATPYGSAGFCNSKAGKNNLETAAGGGGPSACAKGKPYIAGVTSGTCKGTPKPSWQSVFGNPADGVRDIPDVSLFAANGIWNHAYVYCNTGDGGTCTGAPVTWSRAGGTSFAAPIMAGVQALIDQYKGARQGLPNPVIYQLAATEYGTTGSATCNSSKGNKIAAKCIFHDVTLGDDDIDCTGTYNCYKPSGTYGVLSTSDTIYDKAWSTTPGWDFATGIGSINAYNLVKNW